MATQTANAEVDVSAPSPLPGAARLKIFTYLGILIILLGYGAPNGGFIDVPISFFLKNRLHLAAHQVAIFRLMSAIPLYLGIAFGFARDTFNPLGMRDRGFIVLFGAVTSAIYFVFAFAPITYVSLLVVVLLSTVTFQFVASAQNGVTSALGQQHVMSGRVSAAWNIFLSVPVLTSFLLGGMLSQLLEGQRAEQAARILFLAGAAIMAAVAAFGLLRPASVYGNLHIERLPTARRLDDLRRLVSHWPIYPALLIWSLWNFAPGAVTPLQYYLQNTLHATDSQWGQWNAIFSAAFIPTFLLFGLLCRRYPLRTLLFWGTLVAVPQMVPLAFIHSVNGALFAAAIIGLLGGVNSAAYVDLIIRSCPPGLQGAVLMMMWGLYYMGSRFGDVLGTNLYDRYHDFNVCVIAITVVYALIVPALWLVPRRLTATADGEVAPAG